MTVEDFLEKWAPPLNGGDERHLHNDLDHVLRPYREALEKIARGVPGCDAEYIAKSALSGSEGDKG